MSFLWLASGGNVPVTVYAEFRGRAFSTYAKFNIKRPEHSISIYTGSVYGRERPYDEYFNVSAGFTVGAGDIFKQPAVPGISGTASFPNGLYGGEVQWVQIVDSFRYWKDFGSRVVEGGGFTPGLDTDYPYTDGKYFMDAPCVVDPTRNVKVMTVKNTFTMCLMWRPPGAGSTFIPLRKINWGWWGRGALVNGKWGRQDGDISTPIQSYTDEPPTWDNNVTPFWEK